MPLSTETAKSTRSLTYFVRIYTTPGTYSGANVLILPLDPTSADGVPAIAGIRISKSFDSPVPVCQLDLSRVPTWITRGQGVTVDVGYNGLTQRLFTGFIQSRERGVGKGSVQCMGRLWTAFRTVQIGSRSVDGDTVATAIGDILDYVGLTDNRSLTIPAFTLGTASDPVLERMPASQMLQMLMDIDGCRIYELGTGQIIIRVIDEAPAPVAYKTYTTNANATARILEASDREDPEYYRNRVIITGTTITEGSAPDQTSRTITATATNTGSALVQPALPSGTYIDAEYNNHLIDTDAKAADVAIRLLAKFARIPRQLQIELAGDPELELGQTIAFVMPEIDLNDRGFISGIEHVIDSNGYVTRLTDFRGAGDTGGTLSQNPIAAFTFKSEIEVFGATTNVFAALDASNSFDPDGTIASYAWSDNQTTTPEIATLTTQQVLVRGDTSGFTGSWDVTLTVTDNDGLTGSTTITIPYENTDPEIVLPAIYAAINNRHSGSLDGGVNWNDSTVGSGNSISVAARPADGVSVGYACYGTSTGRIYRTTDAGVSVTLVYTSAAAVAINDMQWDWRNPAEVWAVDENCIVYRSGDYGVTWAIYDSLRTVLGLAGALGNKLGLPVGGRVYVWGGTGAGSPLETYSEQGSHTWTNVAFTGDLLTDTVTTPGDATLRVVDYTAGYTKSVMLITWASGGGASITAAYSTADTGLASRAYTRASTTFGGLKTGRYVVSDNVLIKSDYYLVAFANRSVWWSTDGIAFTEITNVMPASVTPWHAIGMTGSTELTGIVGMFGVFMIAASDGIYKYTPRIDATASYVRPSVAGETWPASAVGKKLAIGAPGASSALGGELARIGDAAALKLWDASSTWTLRGTGTGSDGELLMQLRTGDWLYVNDRGDGGTLYHSPDGLTFTAKLSPASVSGVHGFDVSSDGTLWAVYGANTRATNQQNTDPLKIYKSVDNGANWTLAHTDAGYTGGAITNGNTAIHNCFPAIIADKWDANNIFVVCRGLDSNTMPDSIYSTNGGTSFTRRVNPATDVPRGSGSGDSMQFAANSRIVFIHSQSTMEAWYSDDIGATWTQSTDSFDANVGRVLGPYKTTWFNNLVVGLDLTTGTTTEIHVSRDNGATWTEVGVGSLTDDTIVRAIEYDPGADRIYFAGENDVWMIEHAFNGTPAESEITFNAGDGPNLNNNQFLALPR